MDYYYLLPRLSRGAPGKSTSSSSPACDPPAACHFKAGADWEEGQEKIGEHAQEEDDEWEIVPSHNLAEKQQPQETTNTRHKHVEYLQQQHPDEFEVTTTYGSSVCPAARPQQNQKQVGPEQNQRQRQQEQQPLKRARPTDVIAMPGWKDEYLSSLMEAERNSPVNLDLVEACSELNDRVAALEAEKAQWKQTTNTTTSSNPKPPSDPSQTPPADPAPSSSSDPRLRLDLAQALQQRQSLETRLRQATADRDRLAATQRAQARELAQVSRERDALRTRVRDQAEELKGKKAMLDAVQDDVLALETSLTLVEKQKAKLAADNRELVERWMRRARLEAEQMNAENERGTPEGGGM